MRRDVTTSSSLNDQQQLQTVSVHWHEDMPFLEGLMLALATGGFMFGLMFVFFIPGTGLMLLLGGAAAFLSAVFYPGRTRQVTFTADGQILTPYGFAHSGGLWVEGDHAHLTSIELRQMRDGKLFEVFVTSEYGSLFALSTNLQEQVAFKVAVLLTRQLRDMRAAQAARRAGEQSDAGVRRPDWGNAHGVLS